MDLTYYVETVGLEGPRAPIRRITLYLLYVEYANRALCPPQEAWVELNAKTPHLAHTFSGNGEEPGCLLYQAVLELSGGGSLSLPLCIADGNTLTIPAVPPRLTVAIVPALLDWSRLRCVIVKLDDGVASSGEELIFTPENHAPQLRTLDYPQDGRYRWSSVYVFTDGTFYRAPRVATRSPLIVLTEQPWSDSLEIGALSPGLELLPLGDAGAANDGGPAQSFEGAA